MTLPILQERVGRVHVLAPGDRLDSETASALEAVLDQAWRDGQRHFVIDFSAVPYISSAGLRVLLGLLKRVAGGGGSLRLSQVEGTVQQVFALAGLLDAFALYASREAALLDHPERFAAPAELIHAASTLLGAAAPLWPTSGPQADAAGRLLIAAEGSTDHSKS